MMLGWRGFWILMTTMTCVCFEGWLGVGDDESWMAWHAWMGGKDYE